MVHQFQKLGMNLALDVGSGSIHLLDDISYDMLKVLNKELITSNTLPESLPDILLKYDNNSIYSALNELFELFKQGQLFNNDDYQEYGKNLGTAPVKAMCLHISHDCNLRCKYCFASTGEFGGSRQLMSLEVGKKAIDLLIDLSENRHNLEIDFFGGEPLMNYEVVLGIINYARSIEKEHNKNFRFTITTNGLALNDDIITSINREMSNVVLSIDGRREVNDAMRPTAGGKGSYDVILPKFQKLVAERGDKEYYVRGTYTRENLDFDRDVLHLFEQGFDQISVEPVVGPEKEAYAIREQDIPTIETSYNRMMEEMLWRKVNNDKSFNFFHFMMDLDNGPCAIKRLKGCGCGNEYLAVTPTGELYPCHQFVGNTEYQMGTVDAGITNAAMREDFAKANLLNKPECQECWAKFFCSGGCNANNQNYCGSVLTPHPISCHLEKVRLECAIALKAAILLNESS